jgi:signal transduction histidine kinase
MSQWDAINGARTTIRNGRRISIWSSRFLWHNHLLGQRLYLFSLFRFVAAASIVVGALFARYIVGIESLRTSDLDCCAAFLAFYNIGILLAVRPFRNPDQVERGYRRLIWIGHVSIVADYLVLTYGIWLVGGGRSPFLAFYLLHATIASVLLSRGSAFALAGFGFLLVVGIVMGEWMQWIPRNLPMGAVFGGLDHDIRPVITLIFVYGVLMMTATYLMTGIASALRSGEKQLRAARQELEEVADLRRAFLHVVFHDLRSPISTVVTLLDTLTTGGTGLIGDKQKDWIHRAEVKLRGLLSLLHDLQLLADLETGELDGVMEPVDLLLALREVVEDHSEAAQQRDIHLKAELPTSLRSVYGVDRLIREGVANYITNAIKYTQSGGTVAIRARQMNATIRIEVVDNGPGIGDSDQIRLFQEFVRVRGPSEKGSIRPPGSGLGLFIVRRIAEVHHGRAGVLSKVGKGSTFYIDLPAIDETAVANP